jgi:hypothetical protein
MTRTQTYVAVLVVSLAAGCSQGDSQSSPSPTPGGGLTVTIDGNVASPRNLVVPLGSQITFVNRDGSIHEMYSDPHPEHTDCPQFDSVGRLTPGQSRQTANLVTARVCGFHDHLNPFVTTLTGSVRIQ